MNFRISSPLLYSFVLTGESFQFGFVRQEVGAIKAKVLLSFWPWHDIFFKLLNMFAELSSKVSDLEFENFIAMAIDKLVPPEQKLLNLTFCDTKGFIIKELTFRRPIENEFLSIPQNHNLNMFFNYIKPETMVEIFAVLLAERRIIFVSSNLDKISSCVQASCSLLYPMFWQHVFIPILPMDLKDVLAGPMP